MVEIHMPEKSRADKSILIRVSGLEPNKLITIRAITKDYFCINAGIKNVNDTWEAFGTYYSDQNGVVDLSSTSSIEGTYTGVDCMGLFTSMKIKSHSKNRLSYNFNQIPEYRNFHVEIIIEVENVIIARKIHERFYCDSTIECRYITNDDFVARYFTVHDKRKNTAIIVLSGSDGRIEKAQCIAEILSMEGFPTLAIGYFGLKGIKKSLNRVPLEIIEQAIKWLKLNDGISDIAIYGRSKGGELALLSASYISDIKSIVVNNSSCYVYEGLSRCKLPIHHSSWTYRKKEIEYVHFPIGACMNMLKKKMCGDTLALKWLHKHTLTMSEKSKITIRVENINADILFITSDNDEFWDSTQYASDALNRLKSYNYMHNFEHLAFPQALHMLTIAYQSFPQKSGNIPQKSMYEASIISWEKTLDFFNKNLI